jgi:hypothetical protein
VIHKVASAPVRDLFAGMNKWEKARAVDLEAAKRAGTIADWWFERLTLKLADDTRYTPDFLVQDLDGSLRLEEVKGFWRDDAKVKIKVAAAQFPFPITCWSLIGGRWESQQY